MTTPATTSPRRAGFTVLSACLAGITLPMVGCSSAGPKLTDPSPAYLRALEDTRHEDMSPLAGEDLLAAIGRVTDMFSDYTEYNLRRSIPEVYAEELFFRDGFKQYTKRAPLQEYMLRSTEPLRWCTFEFEDAIIAGTDVYLRWIMNLNLERDKPGSVDQVIGMSHLRFNREGKVVFQQDYWDPTDVLYRRIPVANWLIANVKKRL